MIPIMSHSYPSLVNACNTVPYAALDSALLTRSLLPIDGMSSLDPKNPVDFMVNVDARPFNALSNGVPNVSLFVRLLRSGNVETTDP